MASHANPRRFGSALSAGVAKYTAAGVRPVCLNADVLVQARDGAVQLVSMDGAGECCMVSSWAGPSAFDR